MRCDGFRALLNEFIDGDLSRLSHDEARVHADTCPACREELDRMRRLVDMAATLPEEMAPSAGLWDRVAARMEAGPASTAAGKTGTARRERSQAPWRAAAIAALVLVAAGAGFLASRLIPPPGPPVPGEPAPVASLPESPVPGREAPSVATEPAVAVPAGRRSDFAEAQQAFLEAKQLLREAFAAQRGTLSADTVRQVDESLRIIESAVEEIHAALERDPGNRQLKRMLVDAQKREVALLRKVTQTAALQQRW